MTDQSTSGSRGPAPRRYDSPLRRSRAAQTTERIIVAAADLVRDLPSWDWGSVTIQAVAERAGVARRTVYRHFESEAALHAALAARLQEEVGVNYEGLTVDELPAVTGRVFDSLATFSVTPWAIMPAQFPAVEAERHEGLRGAVAACSTDGGQPGIDQEMAAAALDVVWSVASYEILLRDWQFEPERAREVLHWIHDLVVQGLRAGGGLDAPGQQ